MLTPKIANRFIFTRTTILFFCRLNLVGHSKDIILDERDKLIIQTHFSLVWWAESLLSGYFQSSSFKNTPFTETFVHGSLMQPGGAAASLIAPSLYVALVLPKEAIFEQYKDDFKTIDEFIAKNSTVIENTYPAVNPIPFTRHLRNATAHARISIKNSGIEFEDGNAKKNHYFKAAIDFQTLGNVVQQLQLLLRKHVRSLQEAST